MVRQMAVLFINYQVLYLNYIWQKLAPWATACAGAERRRCASVSCLRFCDLIRSLRIVTPLPAELLWGRVNAPERPQSEPHA